MKKIRFLHYVAYLNSPDNVRPGHSGWLTIEAPSKASAKRIIDKIDPEVKIRDIGIIA
jgi:hypothetical protein